MWTCLFLLLPPRCTQRGNRTTCSDGRPNSWMLMMAFWPLCRQCPGLGTSKPDSCWPSLKVGAVLCCWFFFIIVLIFFLISFPPPWPVNNFLIKHWKWLPVILLSKMKDDFGGDVWYWAIQAGLLTPLTFARHRLSPLAAFTSGAYFLHNWRQWQWICEFYTANFKGIFGCL